ncbi:TOG array regulator of axonemal microtubules protein 1-like [Oscarella lobularis]|uniref:TOG array regulator of axonemal microtubules protein 1-like n=1 Tax=Oscarella lobularis TaxID=121494 RepID=UPI0033140A97
MLLVMDAESEAFVDRSKPPSTGGPRVQAIEEVRTALRGGRVDLARESSRNALARVIDSGLADSAWNVRHQAVQLVSELVPHLRDDSHLDALVASLVPRLVANALDGKVALRKAANQTLQSYARNSSDGGATRARIVVAFLSSSSSSSPSPHVVAGLMPTRAEMTTTKNIESLIRVLTSDEAATASDVVIACLDRLKEAMGVPTFNSCLARLPDAHARVYRNLVGKATAATTTNPVTTPTEERNGHVIDSPVLETSSSSSLSFGFIPDSTMKRLRDAEDWRVRVHGINELATLINVMTDARVLMPHLSSFIDFVGLLLDDSNFKVTLTTLDIVEQLVGKASLALKSSLGKLVGGLSKKLGDNKIVRQANMRVFTRLMQAMTPKPVLDALLPAALKHRNSKVREEALNIIVAALLTYPRYEFDLPAVVEATALTLIDNKQRVRQASLELFAVLASSLGSGNLTPLVAAVARAERTFDARTGGGQAGVMAAVQARLARRQLPRINADGLVEHANPVPISSATSVAAHRPSVSGPDIDWILAAPGNVSASASSASAGSGATATTTTTGDFNGSVVSTPAKMPSMNPVASVPTPRRYCSAGKRLPWVKDGRSVGSAKEKSGQSQGAQMSSSSRPPLKAKMSWNERERIVALSPRSSPTPSSGDGSSSYVSLAQAMNPPAPTSQGSYAELHMSKLNAAAATSSRTSMRSGGRVGDLSGGASRKSVRRSEMGAKPLLKPLATMPARTDLFPSLGKQDIDDLLMSNDSLSQSWPRQRPVLASGHGRKKSKGEEEEEEEEEATLTEEQRSEPRSQRLGSQQSVSTPLRRKATMARPGSMTKSNGAANPSRRKPSVEETAAAAKPPSQAKEKYLTMLNQRPAAKSRSHSPSGTVVDDDDDGAGGVSGVASMPIQRKPSIPKPRVRKALRSVSLEEDREKIIDGLRQRERVDEPVVVLAQSTKKRAETLRAASLKSIAADRELIGENVVDGGGGDINRSSPESPAEMLLRTSSSSDSGQGSYSSAKVEESSDGSPASSENASPNANGPHPVAVAAALRDSPPERRKSVKTLSSGFSTNVSKPDAASLVQPLPSFSPSLKNRLSKPPSPSPSPSAPSQRVDYNLPPRSRTKRVETSQDLTIEGNRLNQSMTMKSLSKKFEANERPGAIAGGDGIESPDFNVETPTQQPKFSDSLTKRLTVKSKENEARRTVRRQRTPSEESVQFGPTTGRMSVTSPPSTWRERKTSRTPDRGESVLSGGGDKPVDDVLEPCANPTSALRDALRYIGATSEDWDVKCEGLTLVRRLVLHHPDVLGAHLKQIRMAVVTEIKNLRSSVARVAIQCLGDLYVSLGKLMDTELDFSVRTLLTKGSESSGFIRQDVEKALSQMVNGVSPVAAVKALLATGMSHRSTVIRKMTAQFVFAVTESVGVEWMTNGAYRDVAERVVSAAVQFTMDGSPQARYFGRAMIHCLMDSPEFDRISSRALSEKMQRQLLGVEDGLRAKGLGDLPAEKVSSVKRKNSFGSQSSRASSLGPDSAGSGRQSSAKSDFSDASVMSKSGSVRGKPPRPRPSGNPFGDQQGGVLTALFKRLSSSDWKERYDAVTEVLELSKSSTSAVGNSIVKLFDDFTPRLTDSNSKVNVHALESFEAMVPHLAPYLEPVISLLVPALSSNLASKNPTICTSARNIIGSLIGLVDNALLIQPFASVVQFGNSKAMPFVTEKLAVLVDSVHPRHPKLVHRHVLPVIWHLVSSRGGGGGGKPVASLTGEARLAACALIHIMYANMGQSLIDRARHLPPRDQQALKSLLDTFGPS